VINPKQQEEFVKFDVIDDTTDIRRFNIKPKVDFHPGYEYVIKLPERVFRDINGHYNDSTEVKATLPSDEKLSNLSVSLSGVNNKYILDLQDEKKSAIIMSHVVRSDTVLVFKYLKAAKYCIRVTEDINDNTLVDTGNLLEHKQPEKVKYYKLEDGSEFFDVLEMSEMTQKIDLKEMFK